MLFVLRDTDWSKWWGAEHWKSTRLYFACRVCTIRGVKRRSPAAPPKSAPNHHIRDRFLYQQIAGELRRRIRVGVYGPGTAISTLAELGREFRVSHITIRRALRDLVVEGLVFGRQGLGVFVSVSHRIVRSLGSASTTPFAEEIRKAGAEPGIKELTLSLTSAPEDIAARLGVPPGTQIYRHEKLILADGEPVTRDVSYLPRAIGDALGDALSEEFLFSLLARRGVDVDHVDFRLEAAAASEEEARQFGLPVGFPLIVLHYTPIDRAGSAVVTGTLVSRSDRLSFDMCTRPETHEARGMASAC